MLSVLPLKVSRILVGTTAFVALAAGICQAADTGGNGQIRHPLVKGSAKHPHLRVVQLITPAEAPIPLAAQPAKIVVSAASDMPMATGQNQETEFKALQNALASAKSQLEESETGRVRALNDLRSAQTQLAAARNTIKQLTVGGHDNLIKLADKGEAIYLQGVGEAKIAVFGDQAVLRLPLTDTARADKLLIPAHAERYLRGANAYYIVGSKVLGF